MAGRGIPLSLKVSIAVFVAIASGIYTEAQVTSSSRLDQRATLVFLPPSGRRSVLEQTTVCIDKFSYCKAWDTRYCDAGWTYNDKSVSLYWCPKTCSVCGPSVQETSESPPQSPEAPPPSKASPPPPESSPPPPEASPPPPESSPPPPEASPPPPESSPPPPEASPPPPESSPPPPEAYPPPVASPPPPEVSSPPPPKTSSPPPPAASGGSGPPAEHVELLRLVNQGRADNGKTPLCLNAELSDACYGHSKDMGDNNYFAHDSQDGRTPWDRIDAAGYPAGGGRGENIAAGYPTPKDVYLGWKGSPGHWANILGDFTHMGVGLYTKAGSSYGTYWTQDFGSSPDGKCNE